MTLVAECFGRLDSYLLAQRCAARRQKTHRSRSARTGKGRYVGISTEIDEGTKDALLAALQTDLSDTVRAAAEHRRFRCSLVLRGWGGSREGH